jgi:hypothetical protein
MALAMRKLRLVVLASYLARRSGVIKSWGEPKFVIPYKDGRHRRRDRRSAVKARAVALRQLGDLIVTAPADLR